MPESKEYEKDLLTQLKDWESMRSKNVNAAKKKPAVDLLIAQNPNNPYPVYQMLLKSEMFTTDELIATLESLSQSDLRLKSTGQKPRLILEKAILSIC